jgi:plastocyanin
MPQHKSGRSRITPAAAAAFAMFAAIAVIAAACGGGKDNSDDALTVGGMNETVIMDNMQFEPGNLQVPVGATVTFTNRDSATHDAQADDESWETDNLENGDSEAVTFDTAGEWLYKCTIHPAMKARITAVEPAAWAESND